MKDRDDFSPKLFVVGRDNTLVSILLEFLLKKNQNRFGVQSAGVKPEGRLDDTLKKFLKELDTEGVDLSTFRSSPIGSVLNEHVKLVAYVSPEVKRKGPIVATTGETITLQTDDLREKLEQSTDLETYFECYERLSNEHLPKLLEPLGLEQ